MRLVPVAGGAIVVDGVDIAPLDGARAAPTCAARCR